MKKISTLATILSILTICNLRAQFSTQQAGLRMGYRSGFFYQATSQTGNAESGYFVMAGFRQAGVQLTGLKVFYSDILNTLSPNLFFGWGYGGHAGFVFTDHLRSFGEVYDFRYHHFCPLAGVDGWLAAEYRIRDIPVTVSLNLKPYFEITVPAFVRLMPADLALSVAYNF
jgi:hypothetical protein